MAADGTFAGAFALSIPIAFVLGRWAYVCWVLTPVVMRVRRLVLNRRAARAA